MTTKAFLTDTICRYRMRFPDMRSMSLDRVCGVYTFCGECNGHRFQLEATSLDELVKDITRLRRKALRKWWRIA